MFSPCPSFWPCMRARSVHGFGLPCAPPWPRSKSEEHTSELQSLAYLVCRLLLETQAPTKIPPLPLHDALPISNLTSDRAPSVSREDGGSPRDAEPSRAIAGIGSRRARRSGRVCGHVRFTALGCPAPRRGHVPNRKSTRLNSSH